MKVRDLMTKDVVTVGPDASLREAAALLAEHRVSGLPVTVDRTVVGVLSEADIVLRASGGSDSRGLGMLGWLFDPDPHEIKATANTVAEAMSAPAVTISPTRPVHEAARQMVATEVNRLPVVEKGALVGILTRADIVRAFTRTDSELESEIRDDILRRTFWVEPGSVSVTVVDGRVRLSGKVETDADTEMLPVLVARIPGVVAVEAELSARCRVS
jgi:CBS domain-containing protein